MNSPNTTNVLIPNQHIGAYHVGFMGEWLSREYLCPPPWHGAREASGARALRAVRLRARRDEARRPVRPSDLPAPRDAVQAGTEGYDAGAKILADFHREQVAQFVCDDLDPLGKEIIDCCLHDGTLDDYLALTPMKLK